MTLQFGPRNAYYIHPDVAARISYYDTTDHPLPTVRLYTLSFCYSRTCSIHYLGYINLNYVIQELCQTATITHRLREINYTSRTHALLQLQSTRWRHCFGTFLIKSLFIHLARNSPRTNLELSGA